MQGCLQCRAQGAASFELAGSSPRLTACIHPPNLLPCRLPQAQQGLFTVEVQVGGSQLHACAVERLLGGVETAPPMWMAQPGHRGLRLRPALPPPLPLTPHSEAPCWAAAACCWRWTTRRRWRSCASWRAVPQVCELHRRTRWAPAVGEREGHAVCRQACILVCWVGFCLTRGAVYPYAYGFIPQLAAQSLLQGLPAWIPSCAASLWYCITARCRRSSRAVPPQTALAQMASTLLQAQPQTATTQQSRPPRRWLPPPAARPGRASWRPPAAAGRRWRRCCCPASRRTAGGALCRLQRSPFAASLQR